MTLIDIIVDIKIGIMKIVAYLRPDAIKVEIWHHLSGLAMKMGWEDFAYYMLMKSERIIQKWMIEFDAKHGTQFANKTSIEVLREVPYEIREAPYKARLGVVKRWV